MRSKAVLCVAIMMFTGFRVSDVSRLGPQHRRRDMFKLRLFKNCNRNPYDIEIAIYPILEAVLAMHKVTDLTYIATNSASRSWRPTLPTTRRPTACSSDVRLARWKDLKIYTKNADRARLAGRRSHESTGMASVRNCWR
ncbi:hypothetical protein HFN80_12525 [Rhizobium laguerreae]|uniref:Tyr recombinase domain-containing protein n=1 Tax=Rhizobium laguerreae TaxID=1076926 RepID=A0AAX2QX41_9HYPH|nr:hypothetical protein [Rhizobium laguerreae]MBY3260180.1 hypothetical protein [Rhizobium laguerreae]MBY3276845.1 hypothetical protein [Rhizobium laguerreae]MBY3335439.1 hypothetical protein [Rhizobium laguerreae]MBY3464828.1 hypothetical protein [Rhizobium laguerreae]MBY3484816.1 hypothetical protein [Rhizobium laguerreae]